MRNNRTSSLPVIIFLLLCSSPALAIDYSYDALNRLTHVGYADGSTIDYTYDAAGNRLSRTHASVVVPGVTLSTTSLVFAAQTIGVNNAVQSVTLSNTGTAQLNIAGIVASGDFAQSNDCGTALAAGGSCAISVTFKPTVAGPAIGNLSVSSDAAGSPQLVSLSGTGISFVSKVNQTVSFGAAPVIVVGGTGTVSAISTSGLGVTFSTTAPGVCTISGSIVTAISAGTCTIAADQAGDTNYNAATQVLQNITVVTPLVIKDGAGNVLTTKQTVLPTGSLTLTLTGGTGHFVVSYTKQGSPVTNIAADTKGNFTFTPPVTGAFAGDYTLTVTDTTSNLSTTLMVSVPLKVTESRLNILDSDLTETITVTGGAAYDEFSVVVLDVSKPGPDGNPSPDTDINKIAANIANVTATVDASKGDPATATIVPAKVTAITPFAIEVTDITQPAFAPVRTRRMNIVAENTVTLTVTDANSTTPIKGATVTLRHPDPIIAKSNAMTTTDANGVAAPTLPVGPLIFDVTATGYLPGTITLAQGEIIGSVALTPINTPLTYTGSINAVAPFTLPDDTQVIAVDVNGNTVAVKTGTATTFTLVVGSTNFVPVQFVATATGAFSDIQPAPATGTIVPSFTLTPKPVVVPSTTLNTDVITGTPTPNAGEEIFTAGPPAGTASGATLIEVLGKPTAATDKAAPLVTGSVTVSANRPVIEVLKNSSGIISAPVVYQPLMDVNGNERRKDAGTKPMAVDDTTADTFSIPGLQTVSNIELHLPVNAFKATNAAGNPLTVAQIFSTVSGVVSTSTAGQDYAKLTGGEIVEIDMVAFDNAGNVLSTDVGNTNLEQGMEIRLPIDPNALVVAGFDAATANAAFASGKLVIYTAPTIVDFEAGKVTVVAGPVSYDPLSGKAVFFAKHFSAYGAGLAAVVPGGAGSNNGSSSSSAAASGGGGSISLILLVLGFLWIAKRLGWRTDQQEIQPNEESVNNSV